MAGDEEEAGAGAADLLHVPRACFSLNLRPPDPVRHRRNSADSWKMWKMNVSNYCRVKFQVD